MKGLLVKGIAGFYYVDVDGHVYQCKARGIFKNRNITPIVGDVVEIEETENGEAVINEIYPRKNSFIRPPICNVDVMVVVAALSHPNPNFGLIDRFLVSAEKAGLEIILCFNKTDIDKKDIRTKAEEIYKGIYKVHFISCEKGEGIDELMADLAEKNIALAGPSGVGKSTLLNLLYSQGDAQTGDISRKTGRGRHTTRHVEIFPMDGGGRVFDTPGFTSFEVPEIEDMELAKCFPEMEKFAGMCRFDDCRHLKEPECRVLKALEDGEISQARYDSYVQMMDELKERERKQYG